MAAAVVVAVLIKVAAIPAVVVEMLALVVLVWLLWSTKMKARIVNDTVVEILTPISGFSIEQCFHPSILAQCVDLEHGMQVGWVKQEDGSFAAPEEPSAPA
jgi:hypothetical protein